MTGQLSLASLAATAPILWLLIGLAILKIRAAIVCPLGLALGIAIACLQWDLPARLAAEAALEGAIFACIPIIWIIAAAFFSYNLSLQTGANKHIKLLPASISADPRIQVLLIAWGLGGFMEAAAGFGTSVIIPAALLLSMGFPAMLAATICLLSNTIAVAFGVVGVPMRTLAWITDLEIFGLSEATVIQLTPLAILVPFLMVLCVTRSLKGVAEVWLPTLVAGVVFAAAQFLVALSIGPELAAMAGSICSLAGVIIIVKIFPVKKIWRLNGKKADPGEETIPGKLEIKEQVKAWSPYIFLFLLVLVSSDLVPPLHELFAKVSCSLDIYSGPGGKPLVISWLLTPGTLVLIAAVFGGLWQGAKPGQMLRTYGSTLRTIAASSFTIISLICMAKVLSYSGMMDKLAADLTAMAGGVYPVVSPTIGALGAFISGSNTSANILFGGLQTKVALQLGLDPSWIAASNSSGACIGKWLSPQSISLAAVATGLTNQEGKLLSIGLAFCIPLLVLLGVLVFILG